MSFEALGIAGSVLCFHQVDELTILDSYCIWVARTVEEFEHCSFGHGTFFHPQQILIPMLALVELIKQNNSRCMLEAFASFQEVLLYTLNLRYRDHRTKSGLCQNQFTRNEMPGVERYSCSQRH